MDAVKFKIGQKIYSPLDSSKCGIITGIVFRPNTIRYMVMWSDEGEVEVWEIELTTVAAPDVGKAD